ncbi:MAG: hypothetical protein Q9184_006961, partial [Pyrenodesmia sp. 2 TL-2023]
MAVSRRNIRSNSAQLPDIFEHQLEASKHTLIPLPVSPPSDPTLSEAVDLAVRFKKGLLATLNQEDQLFDRIFQLRGNQIYLGNVNGTQFTIQISELVLEQQVPYLTKIHPKGATTAQHDLFRSDLPKHPSALDITADLFFPLGWLVEHGQNAKYCPTRYVCLLNISTQPMSLWLMYDYVNDNEIEFENTMVVYDDSSQGEATPQLTKAKDLFGGKDLILLYRDVAQWDLDTTTDKFTN